MNCISLYPRRILMMLVLLLVSTTFFYIVSIVNAATPVENDIIHNTVWTKDKSPYVILRSIKIAKNATLIIEPGVEVRTLPYVRITVDGTLIVNGTPDEPVLLRTENGDSPWKLRPLSGARIIINNAEIPGRLLIDIYKLLNNVTIIINNTRAKIHIWNPTTNPINSSIISINNIEGDVILDYYYSYIIYSNVTISNANSVTIWATDGFVLSNATIVNIKESVTIKGDGYISSGSNLTIENIGGKVELDSDDASCILDSNVTLRNIAGALTLVGKDGGVTDSKVLIDNIKGEVYIGGGIAISNSRVVVRNIKGGLGIGSQDYSIIRSNIIISGVANNVKIFSHNKYYGTISYSRVTIDNINGSIIVSGAGPSARRSDILIHNVNGNVIIGNTRYKKNIDRSNIIISYVYGKSIFIENVLQRSTVLITNCSIAYGNGITIGKAEGNVTIKYCNIYRNKEYGLKVEGGFVLAKYNWWGDPSGPYHPELNPNGKGDKIDSKSAKVEFMPWLKHPVAYLNRRPPTPVLSVRPVTAIVGQWVLFDASNSTDDSKVVLYFFDFGDGTTSGWVSTPVVRHKYAAPGNYTVSLLVKDDLGAISRTRATVSIEVVPLKISLSGFRITVNSEPKSLKDALYILLNNSLLSMKIKAQVSTNARIDNATLVIIPIYSKTQTCSKKYEIGNKITIPLKIVNASKGIYEGVAELNMHSKGFNDILALLGIKKINKEPLAIRIEGINVWIGSINKTISFKIDKEVKTILGFICNELLNNRFLYIYTTEQTEIKVNTTKPLDMITLRNPRSNYEQIVFIKLTPETKSINLSIKPTKQVYRAIVEYIIGYLVNGKPIILKKIERVPMSEGMKEYKYQISINDSKTTTTPGKATNKEKHKTKTTQSTTQTRITSTTTKTKTLPTKTKTINSTIASIPLNNAKANSSKKQNNILIVIIAGIILVLLIALITRKQLKTAS